jgi:hypothetical protein
MARRENYQFDYPENGWSTGRMRKKGDQYAKMDRLQRTLPGEGGQLAEMDRAAGMGVAARGGPTGTFQVPGVVPMAQISQNVAGDVIANHKNQLQDGMNQIAEGSMTPEVLKRMLKQFGWQGDPTKGKFLDPNGQEHVIEAEAK